MKNLRWINVSLAGFLLLGPMACDFSSHDKMQTKSRDVWTLDQPIPESPPELVLPGLVSTPRNERDLALSPDGKEIYFSYALPGFSLSTVVTTRLEGGAWSEPEVSSFSGSYPDLEPAFSPDGERLFFISKRPLAEADSTNDWNIWVTERGEAGWMPPTPLGMPVNDENNQYYPYVAENGNLYFTAEDHPATLGGEDIFFAEYRNGSYLEPVNLGEGVNSGNPEFNAYIAPDESFLIFSSWGRGDGIGGGDLYISFRDEDGTWLPASNLGPEINSDRLDYCPFVSPDGNVLFFTSQRLDPRITDHSKKDLNEIRSLEDGPRNGLGDIYQVSFDPDKWRLR